MVNSRDHCCTIWISVFRRQEKTMLTKYVVLAGAMLLNTPNAIPWFIGNLLTYVYSYFRYQESNAQVYRGITWLLPVFLTSVVVGMISLDALLRLLSVRKILLLSIFVYNAGLFLTYLTVQQSIWTMQVTFSVCTGLGHGVMLSLSFVFAQQWCHRNVGTATSVVASSCGLGAVAVTAIATSYLNPNNLKPDRNDGKLLYFSSSQMHESLPTFFLILGIFSTMFHIFAILLLELSALRCAPVLASDETLMKVKTGAMTEISPIEVESLGCTYTEEVSNEIGELQSKAKIMSPSCCDDDNQRGLCECSSEQSFDKQLSTATSNRFQALKSERFYHIWFCEVVMSLAYVTVISCFKLFGQFWIRDDDFLAIIGGVADVSTVFGRICLGFITDYIGVFNTISIMLATNTVGMALWYLTARSSGLLYLIWTSFLIGMQSATYTVFPVAILKHFGSKHYATNVGLSMLSLVCGSLLTPPLIRFFLVDIGWFWIFILDSAASLVALILFLLRVPANVR